MQHTRLAPGLELQPLEDIHANALFTIINADRIYLRRWQNWPDRIRTLRDMRKLIRASKQKRHERRGFDMVLIYEGVPVGKIGLVYIDWYDRRTEIGYWLGADYQRHGYITRACRAITGYALGPLALNCVQIRCAAGNVRSRAVPERLGFTANGTLPNRTWLRGQMIDEVLYSLSTTEWYAHMIYHITATWDPDQTQYIHPSLESERFIHFSTRDQVVMVANAFYHGQTGLKLLAVDPERLHAPLKYEAPGDFDGQQFPHLYGPLNTDAVVNVFDFPARRDGNFDLPEGIG